LNIGIDFDQKPCYNHSMKREDIVNHIGKHVIISSFGNFPFYKHMSKYSNPEYEHPLKILKLTKSGMAFLEGDSGEKFSIPPSNIDILLKD
jgi:hypothetical protein